MEKYWFSPLFSLHRKQEPPAPAEETQSPSTLVDPLDSWMDGAERVKRCFDKATEGAPRDYVEIICSAFLDNEDKDLIYDKVVRLGRLQKSIYKYQNEVYSLVGVAEVYERVSEIAKDVNKVLGWVEEVLCYAMVDAQEVRDRYSVRGFMYQAK